MVRKIRPRIQATQDDITVQVLTRYNEDDSDVESSAATVSSTTGYADVRATGRYVGVKMTTGLHNGILEVEAEGITRGIR